MCDSDLNASIALRMKHTEALQRHLLSGDLPVGVGEVP